MEQPEKPAGLTWFSAEELAQIAAEGQRLAEDPGGIMEVVAKRWMEDTELLHRVFRRLIEQAGNAENIESALKVVVTAMRIHDSKQDMLTPMVRRIMEQFKGKGRLGAAGSKAQVSGRSRPSLGAGGSGRGRAGEPGPDPDPGA